MKQERVSIVMPARNEWHLTRSGSILEKIFNEVPSEINTNILLVANNSEQTFVDNLKDVSSQDDRIKVINLGKTAPLNWSYSYLYGLDQAKNNSDYVVEMDANGSHDPTCLREFINVLQGGYGAAFSTRFAGGGKVDKYPLERQLISRSGTILANLTLGLGNNVSDMTSGYEAFRSGTLSDIFANYPIKNWLSVTLGPGHFYQTEMRAVTIWRRHSYSMVPIVWGTNRVVDVDKIPLKTLTGAFRDLIILRSLRSNLIK